MCCESCFASSRTWHLLKHALHVGVNQPTDRPGIQFSKEFTTVYLLHISSALIHDIMVLLLVLYNHFFVIFVIIKL